MTVIFKAISFDYYDGGTRGVALAKKGDMEYAFSTLWSSWSTQQTIGDALIDVRVFLLEPIAQGTFERVSNLLSEFEPLRLDQISEHVVSLENTETSRKAPIATALEQTVESGLERTIGGTRILVADAITGQHQWMFEPVEFVSELLRSGSWHEEEFGQALSRMIIDRGAQNPRPREPDMQRWKQ